jgi:hypothetical protein
VELNSRRLEPLLFAVAAAFIIAGASVLVVPLDRRIHP